jgi:hypothetical protein
MPDATLPASAVPPFRPAAFVMSPARAAAAVPNALSFARAAMRRLVRGRYVIDRLRFDLDDEGRGEVLYRLDGEGWRFHFFLVSQKLDEAVKTDRNFAQSWDAMGVLCQGEWTPQREALLRREVPRQRAGFADYDTLVYARGNRSARLFDHVVDSLAAGRQPDAAVLAPVGYILRTTAFIGNGQLGTRPLEGFEPDHPFRRPYHVQFASAFVLREYVYDLVDHLARCRNPDAATLAPEFRRYLGLGNAAATGLVPFLVNHPHVVHRWCAAHESALADARARPVARGDPAWNRFVALLDRAIRYGSEGVRPDDGVFAPASTLVADLRRARRALQALAPTTRPWIALAQWADANLGREACETLDAIVLELHPDLVDAADDAFHAQETFDLRPLMRNGDLSALLRAQYGWALNDTEDDAVQPHFWYRTTKTPRDVRRGLRGRVAAYEFETATDTVRQARRLSRALAERDAAAPVGELVRERPDLRHIVTRLQSLAGLDYSELHADWLAPDFSPFGPVRFVLSFFGLEKFEAARPKSVRGTFMQGAPIAEDVAAGRDGDWPFPPMPSTLTSERRPPVVSTSRATVVDCGPPQPADWLRLAPRELARMVQNALQGHGQALGVAEFAADLAVFAQANDSTACDVLLRHCREGAVKERDPPRPGQRASRTLLLEAQSAAAWGSAATALDQAQLHGGTVIVADARDASLLAALPLRAAQRGRLGLIAWHDASGWGFALGAPDARGTWYLRGALAGTPRLFVPLERAADPDGEARDAIERITTALAPVDRPGRLSHGYAFACFDVPAPPVAAAVLDALRASASSFVVGEVLALGGDELAARYDAWRRGGVALTRGQFEALAKAGEAVLVPVDDEHRILAEGMDPLKVF